jgi:hypothetical protein
MMWRHLFATVRLRPDLKAVGVVNDHEAADIHSSLEPTKTDLVPASDPASARQCQCTELTPGSIAELTCVCNNVALYPLTS